MSCQRSKFVASVSDARYLCNTASESYITTFRRVFSTAAFRYCLYV
jgi:hypothetical protein